MKYTEHFRDMSRNFGPPKLDKIQFTRMIDIIFTEGLITGNFDQGARYITEGHRNRKSLNKLTNRQPPEFVYQNLIDKSKPIG